MTLVQSLWNMGVLKTTFTGNFSFGYFRWRWLNPYDVTFCRAMLFFLNLLLLSKMDFKIMGYCTRRLSCDKRQVTKPNRWDWNPRSQETIEKGDENWSPETGGKSVGNPTILLEITSFKKMIPKHSHCSTPTRNIWESFLEFWRTLTPTLYFRSKALYFPLLLLLLPHVFVCHVFKTTFTGNFSFLVGSMTLVQSVWNRGVKNYIYR